MRPPYPVTSLPAPRAVRRDPLDYALAPDLTFNPRRNVATVDRVTEDQERRVTQVLQTLPDRASRARRNQTQHATLRDYWLAQNPASAHRINQAAQLVRTAAGQWDIEPYSVLENRDLVQQRALWRQQFPTRPLRAINAHVMDITPQDLRAYYIRHQRGRRAGTYVTPNGPGSRLLIWEHFSRTLADIAYAALSAFGFPQGSFWQVELVASDGRVIDNNLMFRPPTRALVYEAMQDMSDGTTSGGQRGDEFDQGSSIRVTVYNPGTGRGGQLPAHLAGKTRTVWSPPGDEWCAPKSIVVALARGNDRRHLKDRPGMLMSRIGPLLDAVNTDKSWEFADLAKASEFLDLPIVVLSAHTYAVLYETEVQDNLEDPTAPVEDPIYLLFDQTNSHFMSCLDPNGLSVWQKWCSNCKKLYKRAAPHRCTKFACKFCGAEHATQQEWRKHFYDHEGPWVACATCNKRMPDTCAAVHTQSCKGAHMRCADCGETYINADVVGNNNRAITPEQHAAVCGKKYAYCVICDDHLDPSHSCTITRKDFGYNWDKPRDIWVFDMEAARDEALAGKQVVTFVSARQILEPLQGESKEDYLDRHLAYHEANPPLSFHSLGEFCQWAAGLKNTTLVAHNMSGYDGPMMHNYLRYEMGVKTQLISGGLKTIMFRYKSNKVIDSARHFQVTLAKSPKVMGVDRVGVSKGHFPHGFNTVQRHGYSGPYPGIEYFELDKSRDDPAEVMAWHDVEKRKYEPYTDVPFTYDTLREVERAYCHQDTLVLAIVFGEYRRVHIEMTEVDPAKSPTTASTCLKVYRHAHIPEKGIATLTEEQERFVRKSFHGGRTEVFASYYKCKPGEDIEIVDAQSMYPTCMFDDELPEGEGTKVVSTPDNPIDCNGDWLHKCGFADVDIVPPEFDEEDPYFKPILATVGATGKLEFNLYPSRCVATIVELRECVKAGYTIEAVHELLLFESSTDLFKSYVASYYHTKVESSAPPDDIPACVAGFKERMGIDLDPVKLAEPENAGRRAMAKLCLNNLWGKLCQRHQCTEELVDASGFHKTMARHNRGEIELKGVHLDPYLEDAYGVKYEAKTNKSDLTRLKTNVALGSYITAHARLRLWRAMSLPELRGKVLYCDTDSVAFIRPYPGYVHPGTGTMMGDWESEVPHGVRFDEFIGIAPKVYAFSDTTQPDNPKAVKLKAKGFPMTNGAKAIIKPANLRATQFESEEDGTYPQLTVTYSNFRRQKYGWLYVGEMDKTLSFNPTTQKSRARPDGFYIPFGPHTDRLEEVPNPKPDRPKPTPLPPPRSPGRHVHYGSHASAAVVNPDDNPFGEDELTEAEADALMAELLS